MKKVKGLCAPMVMTVPDDDLTYCPMEGDTPQMAAAARKATPLYSGVRVYFPDSLEAISQVSFAGNEQHNPGTDLHWDRSKSGDELDSADRHLNDRAKGIVFDTDGQRHLAKAAWRVMAALQKEIEAERAADLISEALFKQGDPSYPGAQAINVDPCK